MAINILAIIRPRHAGEQGPPRPLVGKPRQMTRRAFFRRLLGAAFGLAMLDFGAASLAFLWPSLGGGFGGKITLATSVDDVKAQITQTKLPFYFAPGRFYLVPYDPTNDKQGIYKNAGLLAVQHAPYQRNSVQVADRAHARPERGIAAGNQMTMVARCSERARR